MNPRFIVEDLGTKTRLHTRGAHTHSSDKGAPVCDECSVDLPFGPRFVQKLIDWDSRGIFHFIGERLCNEAFNEGPRSVIRRFSPDLTGFKVLDFGCGLGQLSSYFFELGAEEVILVDIEDALVELATVYMEDSGHADKCTFFRIGENDDLNMVEDASLDLIVASEVFEHILPQYRETTLQRLYAKLKPGGIIVITSPNRLHPRDEHTTGLWFAAWFPAEVGAWYARTFSSWRWKDRSTEDLLRQGLRQYSYFEARKVLRPLGARELCVEYPLEQPTSSYRSVKGRIFQQGQRIAFTTLLKHIGPWEAWQATLEIAWAKPAS